MFDKNDIELIDNALKNLSKEINNGNE